MSDNESSLVDDGEDFTQYLGSLSFSEEGDKDDYNDSLTHDTGQKGLALSASELPKRPKARASNILFEVTNAQVLIENKNKFVMYSILVKNSTQDLSPVGIERRYSDFDKLHTQLKKSFSLTMSDVVFPRKQLTGNYKPETIAQRSRSFEQYLSHLGNIESMVMSQSFKQFFYGETNCKALSCFQKNQFSDAVPLLRRVLRLQQKIYGDLYVDTVTTLSALGVCFAEVGCDDQAVTCSDAAVRCLRNGDDSPLLIPLLQFTIRLCWKLGKDKHDLEIQLQKVSQLGRETFNIVDFKRLLLSQWIG